MSGSLGWTLFVVALAVASLLDLFIMRWLRHRRSMRVGTGDQAGAPVGHGAPNVSPVTPTLPEQPETPPHIPEPASIDEQEQTTLVEKHTVIVETVEASTKPHHFNVMWAIVLAVVGLGLTALGLQNTHPEDYQNSALILLTGVGLFNVAAFLLEFKPEIFPKVGTRSILSRIVNHSLFQAIRRWIANNVLARTLYQLLQVPSRLVRRAVSACLRWLRIKPIQVAMLLAAPIFGVLAYRFAGDQAVAVQPVTAVLCWLISIGLVVAGSWTADATSEAPIPKWTRWEMILVVGVATAALLLRSVDITHIPFILGGDEGIIAFASVPYAEGTANNILGVTINNPSLFFFIQSLSIRALGHTIVASRFPSVIAGALAVIAMYWMARSMFGRLAAFFSSAYMAAFHFNIHFSRLGLQNIWDELFAATIMASLWQGWQTGKRKAFVFAGLMWGLSQYFYPGTRLFFVVMLVWMSFALFVDRKRLFARSSDLIMMFYATVIVFLPLIQLYIQYPVIYTEPIPRSFILSPSGPAHNHVFGTGASLSTVLYDQFTRAFLGFTHIPLTDWYTPQKPMLLILPGALFLIGVAYTIPRIKDLRYALILIILFADTIFGVALTTNPPAAQRLLIAVPSVVILVILPLERLAYWIAQDRPYWPIAGYTLTSAVLIAAMLVDVNFYFNVYTPSKFFRDPNDEIANRIANHLNQLGPGGNGWQVYCVCPPRMGFYSHPTIQFLAPRAIGHDVSDIITSPPNWIKPGLTLVIFLPERLAELDLVKQAYPGGTTTEEYYRTGELFFTLYQVNVLSSP